jgi:mRNA-degrading endonuclease toxin of MazEF toxin-antitoxin module
VNPRPRRGEIWTAELGDPKRHWVVILSVDSRNLSDRAATVLGVPFTSMATAGPTVLEFPAGETGLPATSYLRAHFIQILQKNRLIDRHPRTLSSARMRQLVDAVRRAIDPDAP